MTTKVSTETYEKPAIRRYSQFVAMSPAGCKLGHGVFPFQGLKFLSHAAEGKDPLHHQRKS